MSVEELSRALEELIERYGIDACVQAFEALGFSAKIKRKPPKKIQGEPHANTKGNRTEIYNAFKRAVEQCGLKCEYEFKSSRYRLHQRSIAILQLKKEKLTYQEIAEKLGISTHIAAQDAARARWALWEMHPYFREFDRLWQKNSPFKTDYEALKLLFPARLLAKNESRIANFRAQDEARRQSKQ